jgi:hypothetical protein
VFAVAPFRSAFLLLNEISPFADAALLIMLSLAFLILHLLLGF